MNTMILTQSVLDSIRQTIGSRPAECGGILGADDSGMITRFYFDETGCGTPDSYEPDVNAVNEMLIRDWLPNGIRLAGIVHSHANGNSVPSCGDIRYGMRILQALGEETLFYLPIVTGQGEEMTLSAFAVEKTTDHMLACQKLNWTTIL